MGQYIDRQAASDLEEQDLRFLNEQRYQKSKHLGFLLICIGSVIGLMSHDIGAPVMSQPFLIGCFISVLSVMAFLVLYSSILIKTAKKSLTKKDFAKLDRLYSYDQINGHKIQSMTVGVAVGVAFFFGASAMMWGISLSIVAVGMACVVCRLIGIWHS